MKVIKIRNNVMDLIILIVWGIACFFSGDFLETALIIYFMTRILYVIERIGKKIGVYDDAFIVFEKRG